MSLKSQIESLLFVSSKPLSLKEIAKILQIPESEAKTALQELFTDRKDSGIVLLDSNDQYQLASHAENTAIVKNFLNSELREKLTEATIEVLAIIAYRQPVSKAEVEAIRGVNSQYSIRHLLMRGLIEKVSNPTDARSSLYKTTTEFLQHLGLNSVNDLPEFEKLVGQIQLPETPAVAENPVVHPLDSAKTELPPETTKPYQSQDSLNTKPIAQTNETPLPSPTPEEPKEDEFDEDDEDEDEDEDEQK
ncbi:MAG: SMC-Scp complex subunit ScpB [Candidatus Doudnabacteria bacterium]|nr:SMC-Scp complex subunit ScpB [Candidatus Doudnabacteria bacterium]